MDPNQYYGYSDQPQQQHQYQSAGQPEDPAARKQRIILFGAGVVFGLSLLVAIASVLFAPTSIRPKVSNVAAMHFELARVADLATTSESARSETAILAANIRISALNSVTELSAWSRQFSEGAFTDSELATLENKATDQALTDAVQVNNYDEVFDDAMEALLTTINETIREDANDYTSREELADIMGRSIDNNTVLLEAISSSQSE